MLDATGAEHGEKVGLEVVLDLPVLRGRELLGGVEPGRVGVGAARERGAEVATGGEAANGWEAAGRGVGDRDAEVVLLALPLRGEGAEAEPVGELMT